MGTSTISGSGPGGSGRDVAVGGSRSADVVGGLGALGWEPDREGGMEGSPGNVFGTTSGRDASREAIRMFQRGRVTMVSDLRTLGLRVNGVRRVHEIRINRRYSLQNVLRLDKLHVQATNVISSTSDL
jgi:hypothetical protein